MTFAVEVIDVTKRFRLFHEKYTSLKERAIHLGHIPYEEFWALRDISMEIEEGETVGLLGHNGSGKSTLLKCIAGILQPTAGVIKTRGRLAGMLELGAGFHPDLTGRENVFLNAAVLGMSKRDIAGRFDEIVAFAELEQFIDNQVKYYSSGMYVRLGFAVAINMDPDILLIDEVLAVGDELFQRKCLDRIKLFQREGRTIIFVTHGADLVRQICDRATVLDQGRQVVELVPPGDAVRTFREHLMQRKRYTEAQQLGLAPEEVEAPPPEEQEELDKEARRTNRVRITSVSFDHDGEGTIVSGEPVTIRIGYEANEPIDDIIFGIQIYDTLGKTALATNTEWLECEIPPLGHTGEVAFHFESLPLNDGTYPVTVGLVSRDEATVYDWHEQRYELQVSNPSRAYGMVYVPVKVSFK